MKGEPLKILVCSLQQQLLSEYDAISRIVKYPLANFCISADAPIGIFNRRGEEYTFGDIWYLATSPRPAYTFSGVSEKNFKYINVVERKTIESVLHSGEGGVLTGGSSGPTLSKSPAVADIIPIDENFPLQLGLLGLGGISDGCHEQNKGLHSQVTPSLRNSKCDNSDTSFDFHGIGNDTSLGSPVKRRCKPLNFHTLLSASDIFTHSKITETLLTRRSTEKLFTENGTPSKFSFQQLSCPSVTTNSAISIANASFSRVAQMAEISLSQKSSNDILTSSQKSRSMTSTSLQNSGGSTSLTRHLANNPSRPLQPYHSSSTVSAAKSRHSILSEVLGTLRMKPMIIVPTVTSSTTINKSNVSSFLQHGEFLPPTISMATNSDSRQEVTRKVNGRPVKFRIIGSSHAQRLSSNEWRAVVAVIVQGPEWQFKNWPFKTFQDLFRSIKAFYFTYDDMKIPQSVQFWHVQVMRINRTQKHCHSSVQSEFWSSLEEFLLSPRKAFPCEDAKLKCDE